MNVKIVKDITFNIEFNDGESFTLERKGGLFFPSGRRDGRDLLLEEINSKQFIDVGSEMRPVMDIANIKICSETAREIKDYS